MKREPMWRKSSRCEVANCVEVAFVKSARRSGTLNCVEVGVCRCGPAPAVAVRDSKDRDGPVLRFTADAWDAFVRGVRMGEFDFG